MSLTKVDAIVIGGGFYGCSIATYLKGSMRSVLLVEQETGLFRHASYGNQARVHNGYHYPRSLPTAYRSRVNFPAFVKDFGDCVVRDFDKLYCVARDRSKVTARQFERFCGIIGACCKPARPEYAGLFNRRLIEAVYETEEYAFNSDTLRDLLENSLHQTGVEIRTGLRADRVEAASAPLRVFLSDGSEVEATYIFNCTYAGLKSIAGMAGHCRTQIRHEIAEMALIEPPEKIRNLGITVMCGPFFSTMPFPPRGLHTLSHVRYTPHCSWVETGESGSDPYSALRHYDGESKALHMLNDARRYLPALEGSRVVDSIFEIKTLLMRNEIDDGRPILMERSETAPNLFSIMGGKIDNIYDIIQRLQAEGL